MRRISHHHTHQQMPPAPEIEAPAAHQIQKPCPACGHETMEIANLHAPGSDREIYIKVIPPDGSRLDLDVWVCRHCGHVELHIPPNELDDADGL